jgi:hypothetical protein
VLESVYLPDFKLGVDTVTGKNVYLEMKQWFPGTECLKYMAVVDSNPGLILLVLAEKITDRELARLNGHHSGRLFAFRGVAVLPTEWFRRIRWQQPKEISHGD